MAIKKRSVSSSHWLHKHLSDKYVKQAQKDGLRSRAWFKLNEMQRSNRLFHTGMTVVDLGAAPGSWSQYIAAKIGKNGRVIACDILPIDPIVGVEFLQGDICQPIVMQMLLKQLGKHKVQVILSDMAPNISGTAAVDIPHSIYLAERVLNICKNVLAPSGNFLVKVFQGEGLNKYLQEIHSMFNKVKICKPDASRASSRELYIVATGRKL